MRALAFVLLAGCAAVVEAPPAESESAATSNGGGLVAPPAPGEAVPTDPLAPAPACYPEQHFPAPDACADAPGPSCDGFCPGGVGPDLLQWVDKSKPWTGSCTADRMLCIDRHCCLPPS